MNAPLFRDPMYDGAADPVVIWNREAKEWWMIYTNRRATQEGPKFGWVHGTDLGVASSSDGGATWLYRGTLEGLETEWGRNTFWAPEIIWHDGLYHMYVTYVHGVPINWSGKARVRHYTSSDLIHWKFESTLGISRENVIDACVYQLPNGMFRMWFKQWNHTYAADSKDLYNWQPIGPVITDVLHEGPNVFHFKGYYWMIIDEWKGQGVYRSDDLDKWERQGRILEKPGLREEDGTIANHADVVVQGDQAYIFYFTHPGRVDGFDDGSYHCRRTSIQVARLDVLDGLLTCDRNESFELKLAPDDES